MRVQLGELGREPPQFPFRLYQPCDRRAAEVDEVGQEFRARVALQLMLPGCGGAAQEPDVRFAEKVLAQVEELAVSREIASIKSRLQRMNPLTEQADYNHMFGDLVALEQRRKSLLDRGGLG